MEYRTHEEVAERAQQIAPVAANDINQLNNLVDGVREYCDRMEILIPPVGGKIDVSKMSWNMDGDRQ
jgi:hypothetical protein